MSWQAVLRSNLLTPRQLVDHLQLAPPEAARLVERPSFRVNIPLRLANKMPKGTLDHPVTRQFVPLLEELDSAEGFIADPVGDSRCRPHARLLHKYVGRVLLTTTGACAMHCRYCFRQHFDYTQQHGFEEELLYIRKDPSIREVILSGGDPLSLSNGTLGRLLEALDQIPHVAIVRFHTRFPIGIPERIDEGLLELLRERRAQIWWILHSNCAEEWDDEIRKALARVRRLGIPLLNQAVFLKGVNDTVASQQALLECLIDQGIQPYYLHQLDRVAGAAHFEVPEEDGHAILEELRTRLPGYALPSFVKEEAGAPSKTRLQPTLHTLQQT